MGQVFCSKELETEGFCRGYENDMLSLTRDFEMCTVVLH